MKKNVFNLILMSIATLTYAQDLRFGMTAGPNWSTVRSASESFEKPQYATGFQFGAFAEWPLADKVSLRPELKYISLRQKYPVEEDQLGYYTKSSYITIPLLVEYAVAEKLKVGLGPYGSLHLKTMDKYLPYEGAEDDYEDTGMTFDFFDESMHYNKLNFGIATGLNYQVLSKVGVDLRYNLGLSDFLKKEVENHRKYLYRFFSLGVSYSIR